MTGKHNDKLGRGLSALLGDYLTPTPNGDEAQGNNELQIQTEIVKLEIHKIKPGQSQPRTHFKEEEIQDLVNSIREKGVLQPIIVRPLSNSIEDYEIIAGERRWRASKVVGLDTIPAIIFNCDDREALEIALIENIQRENLNAIEEAEGYQRLIMQFNRTQEEIAASVGKSRSHIANLLRLNSLPENIKLLIQEGKISAGHARALVNVQNAEEIANEIIKKKLNVRDTESLVQSSKKGYESDPELIYQRKNLEKQIADFFNVPVQIRINQNGGSITIKFNSYEELDEILEKIRPI